MFIPKLTTVFNLPNLLAPHIQVSLAFACSAEDKMLLRKKLVYPQLRFRSSPGTSLSSVTTQVHGFHHCQGICYGSFLHHTTTSNIDLTTIS